MKHLKTFEQHSKEPIHFGFENKSNADKAKKALKEADIEYDYTENFGIYYFDFKNKSTINKAIKIVKDVIDKTKESEW